MKCNFGTVCYESSYCASACNAEVIRNCCVNLGLDPDMEDGRVLNFDVFRAVSTKGGIKLQRWNYDPVASIGTATVSTSDGARAVTVHLRSNQ